MSTTTTQLLPSLSELQDPRCSHLLQAHSGSLALSKPSAGLVPLPPARHPVSQVLDKDKDTPDNHVPRDSRLIRLTGVHPFNAEAPLTALYNEGTLGGCYQRNTTTQALSSRIPGLTLCYNRLPYVRRSFLCQESWTCATSSG